MDAEENQKQVSLAFPPRPWKSLPRFPHSHRPDHGYLSQIKNQVKSKNLYGDRGKVEIQNQDFHFSTVPIRLRRKEKTSIARSL